MLSSILQGGESSRLYQKLVKDRELVAGIGGSADERIGTGSLMISATVRPGSKHEDVEAAIYEEIERLKREPVAGWELEKAKNQLITQAIRQRENNDGKAIIIERAVAYQDDPKAVNTEVQKLQAVTAADVQRVMKKYFGENNRVVIYYTQGEGEKK